MISKFVIRYKEKKIFGRGKVWYFDITLVFFRYSKKEKKKKKVKKVKKNGNILSQLWKHCPGKESGTRLEKKNTEILLHLSFNFSLLS